MAIILKTRLQAFGKRMRKLWGDCGVLLQKGIRAKEVSKSLSQADVGWLGCFTGVCTAMPREN